MIKMCDEDINLEDTCLLCNKILANGASCTDHDDKVKQYECLFCDLTFSRQASLVWHLKTAHDYKLNTNSKKSPSGSEHNYYERPTCTKCNVELLNAYELEKHTCGSSELESPKFEHSTQENEVNEPSVNKIKNESSVTQSNKVKKLVDSPAREPSKIKKPVESSVREPSKVKKPVESSVREPSKVKKPVELPVREPSKVKKPVELPVREPSKIKKPVESAVREPSKIKKPVESPVREPNKVKKPVESPVREPNKVKKPVESPVREPNKVKKPVESPVIEPNKVKKELSTTEPIKVKKEPSITEPNKVKKLVESPVTQTSKAKEAAAKSPVTQTTKGKKPVKSPGTEANKSPLIHCSNCNKDFSSQDEYHKHLSKYATRYRPFFCCICQTTFSRKRSLIFHLYIHKRSSEPESKVSRLSDIAAPPRAFPYPPTPKRTPVKKEVQTKTPTRKSPKKEVDTGGPARKSARISIETIKPSLSKPVPKDEPQIIDVRNNDVSNQKCTRCQKKFKKVVDLETHMIKDHQAPLMHKCSLCPEAFVLKPSLLNHAIGHIF